MASKYNHKEIGYNLMSMLYENISSKSFQNINKEGIYQSIIFENNYSIRFSKWRRGTMPFYLMLYNNHGRYIFELDLSMLVEDDSIYYWNLKSPSNSTTRKKLIELYGIQTAFESSYTEIVMKQKKELNSGINTPRNGFHFVNGHSWDVLCNKLSVLITSIIEAHGGIILKLNNLDQAKNDEGFSTQQSDARMRSGQRLFRKNLLLLYDGKCAISGYNPAEALDAVHIVDHSLTGNNHTDNGIILRSDLHKLFDLNLLKINPQSYTVVISNDLQDTPYWDFNNVKLRERINGEYPAKEYLKRKWDQLN